MTYRFSTMLWWTLLATTSIEEAGIPRLGIGNEETPLNDYVELQP